MSRVRTAPGGRRCSLCCCKNSRRTIDVPVSPRGGHAVTASWFVGGPANVGMDGFWATEIVVIPATSSTLTVVAVEVATNAPQCPAPPQQCPGPNPSAQVRATLKVAGPAGSRVKLASSPAHAHPGELMSAVAATAIARRQSRLLRQSRTGSGLWPSTSSPTRKQPRRRENIRWPGEDSWAVTCLRHQRCSGSSIPTCRATPAPASRELGILRQRRIPLCHGPHRRHHQRCRPPAVHQGDGRSPRQPSRRGSMRPSSVSMIHSKARSPADSSCSMRASTPTRRNCTPKSCS